MPYCPKCGANVTSTDIFCYNCGTMLSMSRPNNSTSASHSSSAPVDMEKERHEAVDAGEQALVSLNLALEELNRARNWGIVDLLGGGMITSMIKHSKMNNAQMLIETSKRDLGSFARELRDLNSFYNININTDDFLSFADWFFDGFVVDFMVQDRINQARDQVQRAINEVERILDSIR